MGDAISSLLFQPPPPTRLKESKVIWLTNSYGKRIPSFFIECAKDARTGEGLRAPLLLQHGDHAIGSGGGEGGDQHYHQQHHHHPEDDVGGGNGGYYNYNNNSNTPPIPSTPQIRTPKELESFVLSGQLGRSGVPTILYSHANAEDLGNIYPWCKFLSKMLGVNVFAYDYTGYGLATDQGESIILKRNEKLGGGLHIILFL